MEEWDVIDEARDQAESLIAHAREFLKDDWLSTRFHLLMHGLVHTTPVRNLVAILRDRELSPGSNRSERDATYGCGNADNFGRDSVCLFDFESCSFADVLRHYWKWRSVLCLDIPRQGLRKSRGVSPFEEAEPHPDDLVVLFQIFDPALVRRVRKNSRPRTAGPIELPAVEVRYGEAVRIPETADLHFLLPGRAWWTVDLQMGRRLGQLSPEELLSRVLASDAS